MSLPIDQFDFIRRLLEEQVGMALELDQQIFVENRLLPVAQRHGWRSLDPLIGRLRDHHDRLLAQEVVESLMTHETSFFRDPHYFDELTERVLPRLIASRAKERRLAIWCAACSTGQEPFSIAMILRERFTDQLRDWQVELLATDVSTRALDQAQSGRYSDVEARRGLSEIRLAQHFRRDSAGWLIDDRLRQMVRFQRLNLLTASPETSPVDLILLRNVLIYLTPSARQTMLSRVKQAFHPDGHLMLGITESSGADGFVMPTIRPVVKLTERN